MSGAVNCVAPQLKSHEADARGVNIYVHVQLPEAQAGTGISKYPPLVGSGFERLVWSKENQIPTDVAPDGT